MFPLRKEKISLTNSETDFLKDYSCSTEIPLHPHPGSFSRERKNHIHEGVDLYCEKGDSVFAIEDGVIVKIKPFTGTLISSPWWNDTWCVLIEGKTGVFNYGEIIPNENLKEGMSIKEGEVIGTIETVLKKDKGRPMNMLHLELYKHGTKDAILEWALNQEKPEQLLDPTQTLIILANLNNISDISTNKRKLK